MGYSIEEVAINTQFKGDYKSCVLTMLSVWRFQHKDDRVKTIKDLLNVLGDALLPGHFRILQTVINGKCDYHKCLLEICD